MHYLLNRKNQSNQQGQFAQIHLKFQGITSATTPIQTNTSFKITETRTTLEN